MTGGLNIPGFICPRNQERYNLFADRTSTDTFRANQLRALLISCAYVLVEGRALRGAEVYLPCQGQRR